MDIQKKCEEVLEIAEGLDDIVKTHEDHQAWHEIVNEALASRGLTNDQWVDWLGERIVA